MKKSNFSPHDMFLRMAENHCPECAFAGRTPADFRRWKNRALPRVMACLGEFPPAPKPDPELVAEWEHDGIRKQRWVIDVHEHMSTGMQVNIPGGIGRREKRPAILCWHGHGGEGKEPVMGNESSAQLRDKISAHNYNYGHKMAKAGFVTFAIDWMGQGEHLESARPNLHFHNGGRDWCNLYYLQATMLGMTSISVNVAHAMAAIGFACSLPFVDGGRLGVMGLSGGGTMSLWTALCDRRIKAAEIICYSDLFAAFGFRDLNYCGMQVAPGLFKLVDLPDLQGLLAPMPLLVDIGIHDTCFRVDTAMQCFKKAKRIYAAAGASGNLELDLFPNEHAWGGNKSLAFFGRHLGFAPASARSVRK